MVIMKLVAEFYGFPAEEGGRDGEEGMTFAAKCVSSPHEILDTHFGVLPILDGMVRRSCG